MGRKSDGESQQIDLELLDGANQIADRDIRPQLDCFPAIHLEEVAYGLDPDIVSVAGHSRGQHGLAIGLADRRLLRATVP